MTVSRPQPNTKRDLQATYNDLLALQDQTDQVPLTIALDAVGAALRSLDAAATALVRPNEEFCAACGRHHSVHPYDLCGIFIPHEEAATQSNPTLIELAQALIGIQEDMPSADVRNTLGLAAHYLEKFARGDDAQPSPDGK